VDEYRAAQGVGGALVKIDSSAYAWTKVP
jgi:hypothetical protein